MVFKERYSLAALILMGVVALVAVLLFILTGRPESSMAAFALIALLPLARRLLRPKEGVISDERDEEIEQRAVRISYHILWIVFVLLFAGGAYFLGGSFESFPLRYLGLLPFVAGWLLVVLRSTVTLFLYRRAD